MTDSAVSILRDGSQVSEVTLFATIRNLQAAAKEDSAALFDLVEKCKNANYKFLAHPFGDSKAILKKRALINEKEEVRDDVRKIILNSIEIEGLSLKLVNPLQDKKVTVVEKKNRHQIESKL